MGTKQIKKLYSGNGCGAQIFIFEYGRDNVKISNTPAKYSKLILKVKFSKTVIAKFIKFVHSSYLGIGY